MVSAALGAALLLYRFAAPLSPHPFGLLGMSGLILAYTCVVAGFYLSGERDVYVTKQQSPVLWHIHYISLLLAGPVFLVGIWILLS